MCICVQTIKLITNPPIDIKHEVTAAKYHSPWDCFGVRVQNANYHMHWSKPSSIHDDVIKWKHFPRYWPFVLGIHRSPVYSPHKGQWRGALMFSLIYVWINGWVHNGEDSDLGHFRAHYDVTVMMSVVMVLSSGFFSNNGLNLLPKGLPLYSLLYHILKDNRKSLFRFCHWFSLFCFVLIHIGIEINPC